MTMREFIDAAIETFKFFAGVTITVAAVVVILVLCAAFPILIPALIVVGYLIYRR